jgi:hypothetical protein
MNANLQTSKGGRGGSARLCRTLPRNREHDIVRSGAKVRNRALSASLLPRTFHTFRTIDPRREGVRERKRPQGGSGLALTVTLAVLPAEATPDSTSAVLRRSQVQITLQAAASASHQADQVETSSSLTAAINCRSSRYC